MWMSALAQREREGGRRGSGSQKPYMLQTASERTAAGPASTMKKHRDRPTDLTDRVGKSCLCVAVLCDGWQVNRGMDGCVADTARKPYLFTSRK
mmetsp:Transcript_25751/g.74265  ORF Transcript_25751/g.74265 Transcript_25751/m.74265 type:complete len:94 (-) Transcript_25751:284-565(-)